MAKIAPFVDPSGQIVPPQAILPIIEQAQSRAGILPGTSGVIPPEYNPSAKNLLTASMPQLSPETVYQENLQAIPPMDFKAYRGADSIAPVRQGQTPEYDTQGLQDAQGQAARLAAIINGIATLGGAGSQSSLLAAKIGGGFLKGSRAGLDESFNLANKRFASDNQTEQDRITHDIKMLQIENQGVDQWNDNQRSLRNNAENNAQRKYGIDSANQRAQAEAEIKTQALNDKKAISDQRSKETQLRQFVELAKTGLLTPDGEAKAAKIINELSGTGFSSDFLLSMNEKDRQHLAELSLSRQQKEKLAKLQMQNIKEIAAAHDAVAKQRQKDADGTRIEVTRMNNETAKAVAAFRNSPSGKAMGDVGQAEVRARLQVMSSLGGTIQRNVTSAARYEKMAQDILKNPNYQGRKSDPMGLTATAYAEYQRLRAESQRLSDEAEKAKETYNQARDGLTSFMRSGFTQAPPAQQQAPLVLGSEMGMRSGYSADQLKGVPNKDAPKPISKNIPPDVNPSNVRQSLRKVKVNGEDVYVVGK